MLPEAICARRTWWPDGDNSKLKFHICPLTVAAATLGDPEGLCHIHSLLSGQSSFAGEEVEEPPYSFDIPCLRQEIEIEKERTASQN